jgi:hypothetical protein
MSLLSTLDDVLGGRCSDLTMEEVASSLETGTIMKVLERFPMTAGLWLLLDDDQLQQVVGVWRDIAVIDPDRKLGIHDSGLAWLVAMTLKWIGRQEAVVRGHIEAATAIATGAGGRVTQELG